MGMDGQNFPFAGSITSLSVRQGVVTQQFFQQKQQESQRLEALVRQTSQLKKISVRLLPDESHARLQHVKDIMNAAGVATLSDLDTLPVRQRIPLSRGQVLVAPRKGSIHVNWSDVVTQFRTGQVGARRELLATHLTNQNSSAFLRKLPIQAAGPGVTPPAVGESGATATDGVAAPPSGATLRTLTAAEARLAARVRVPLQPQHTGELVKVTNNKLTAIDASLLEKLNSNRPALWPTTSVAVAQAMEIQTIPIDSAVVIAGTLDLTEQRCPTQMIWRLP
jgi:hypothetical protein